MLPTFRAPMSSKASSHAPVVVLGGGLTGLSTALGLQDVGIDYRLYEREAHAGGLATTVLEQGFRFDRTGHLLHIHDPDRAKRILSWLDEEPLLVRRRSAIFSNWVYTRYPFQANFQGLPPEVAYRCLLDFIAAQFATAPTAPDNFEQYCRAHFGDAVSDIFMLPYNSKLWGVAPRDISIDWCERFVPVPNLEDVIAGTVGHNPPELGYNAHAYYPRYGIGELSSGMARRLSNGTWARPPRTIDVRTRTIVFDSGNVTYDLLVSTIPLPTLLELISDLPGEVSDARGQLRCTRLYYLDMALERRPLRSEHWIYIPEARYPFYRVGSYSTFCQDMVPDGRGSLYVELVDRNPPCLNDLVPTVLDLLIEMGMIGAREDVRFVRLRNIDHAYVIYDQRRTHALQVIRRFLDQAGIRSTGRYGGWNYSSMDDAIRFGDQAARWAKENLR